MTNIHTIIGPDGKKPQIATMRKTLVDAPILGSLPASLNIAAGTATYGSLASTHGYVQVATAATTSSAATIQTTDSYTIGTWATLWAQFDGVRLDGSGQALTFFAQFRGASTAFALNQSNTDATIQQIRYGSSAQNSNADIRSGAGRGAKHHQITLGIDLARKTAMWRLGEGELQIVDLPALTDLTGVRPQLGIITNENVSHYIRCSSVKVWGEYN